MDLSSVKSAAYLLALGESTRITCECSTSGRSRNLSITKDVSGAILYHCFKCAEGGKLGRGFDEHYTNMHISDSSARRLSEEPIAVLPEKPNTRPIDTHVHEKMQEWLGGMPLLKFGDLIHCGIKYGGVLNQVLHIPLYSVNPMTNELIGYISRDFESRNGPKWVLEGVKPSVYIPRAPIWPKSSVLIVTEDAISSIILSQFVPSVSVLGTASDGGLSDTATWIRQGLHTTTAIVWFDNDNTRVLLQAQKCIDKLSRIFDNVYVVPDYGDPKRATATEIDDVLSRVP